MMLRIIQNLPEGFKADVGSVALVPLIRLQGLIKSKARHGVVSFSCIYYSVLDNRVCSLQVVFCFYQAVSFRAVSYAGLVPWRQAARRLNVRPARLVVPCDVLLQARAGALKIDGRPAAVESARECVQISPRFLPCHAVRQKPPL